MGRNLRAGFTLLELMMAIAVIGVVMAIAIPNFATFRLNARMTSTANDLIAALNSARSEAIKRQLPVAFCGSAAPEAAPPTCGTSISGWVVWQDTNNDRVIDADEPVISTHDPLPAALTPSSNFAVISYGADGFARLQPTTAILLCDQRDDAVAGNQYRKRIVALSATGRPVVVKAVAEVTQLADPADPTGGAGGIDEDWQCAP